MLALYPHGTVITLCPYCHYGTVMVLSLPCARIATHHVPCDVLRVSLSALYTILYNLNAHCHLSQSVIIAPSLTLMLPLAEGLDAPSPVAAGEAYAIDEASRPCHTPHQTGALFGDEFMETHSLNVLTFAGCPNRIDIFLPLRVPLYSLSCIPSPVLATHTPWLPRRCFCTASLVRLCKCCEF